jgi:hypothetical protein
VLFCDQGRYAGVIREHGATFLASDFAGRSIPEIFRGKTSAILALLDAQRRARP